MQQPDQAAVRHRHRSRRAFTAIVAVVAIGLTAAACGSSKTSSTATTTGGGTATTTSGGTTAPTTSGTSGGSTGLAAAKAFVAKYTVQPTSIGITTPVGKPIPKGKKLAFIPCGPNPECQQEGQIVKQAASLLGWSEVTVSNTGTPESSKEAFEQAIQDGANGILYTAIDESVFASLVPEMKAKNIVLSACCNLYPAGTDQVIYDVDTPSQTGPIGGGQAALIADQSNCTNADSVVVNIPDLTILGQGVVYFKKGLNEYCPSAKADELDIALANIGTATTSIVSYLRAHTDVKYVVATTDGLTIGLPAALKAAGLSDVKIIGNGATATNIQYLHAGQQAGDTAFPYNEVMYAMVDAVARYFAGATVLPSVAPPLWLLTPSNVPNTTAAIFPVVNDFQAQYKKLWGLG